MSHRSRRALLRATHRSPRRGPRLAPARSRRPELAWAALALAALAGCVAYEPAPIDLGLVLEELSSARQQLEAGRQPGSGATLAQLAAFAVAHQPALRAERARVGLARAQLVEAGLLADPELGWNAMDVLASQIAEGTSSSVDVLSGLSLSLPLPRPGERDAAEGAARWRVEEARRRVLQAEWLLARDVFVAAEDLREARLLLAQHEALLALAQRTADSLERAREAGAATAVQAKLALGDLLAIRARRLELEAELRAARDRLDALLGLPPGTPVELADEVDEPGEREEARAQEDARAPEELAPEALLAQALERRPDLALLLASHAVAEEELRLAVARQLPLLAIGTGVTLVPGLLTRFQRPAIESARARRAALRAEVEAAVHEARRELREASAARDEARRALAFLEASLLPNAEESVRLASRAFAAGEGTLLETLELQRALVDARTRTARARAELRRARWRLRAAAGVLLGTPASPAEDAEGGTR